MSPNPNNQNRGKGVTMIDINLEPCEDYGSRDRGKNIGKSRSFEERINKPSDNALSHSKSHTIVSGTRVEKKQSVSSLVDELLSDIYGKADVKRKRSVTNGDSSFMDSDNRQRGSPWLRSNLKQMEVKCWCKDNTMLKKEVAALKSLVAEESNNLVKYLKRKDYLLMRREAHYDVITAVIQAISSKTRDDMKMKFSLAPGAETGFSQWLDAMKMVAQLPGGVPSEFRTKLWLQLSERHLTEQNIDWEKAEAVIFNEWTNPDDEELGVQIVKDLHRTGCSLFCGAQEQNQALLKRVLLAYARWNKNVGYCQGFNMLAALILQVMDRDEKNAVKVMIYLIEGVLPESYFANNLRGLSVDMAVFRDLLRLRLPKLSKHLEALQNDTNSGTSYEPPLTNVFTMQWFLTLFSNCLPQQTVLRVWDLVFLHGNEVLLRTALAIWGILQDRIMSVESADEFYSIMGVVTREMLEFGLMDANNLIKMIVMVDPFPTELQELREKYLYNISPWTQSVQSAARKGIKLFYSDPEDQDDTEDEDKIALATAYGVFRRRESGSREVQPIGPTLDISVLKQQYAKLRERQRQAHIIISAACSSSIPANLTSVPTVSVNHLLMGKSALVNKGRRIGPLEGSIPPPKNRANKAIESNKQAVKKEKPVISGETLEWKDAEKRKCSTKSYNKISNMDNKVANNKIKNNLVESCNGLNRKAELKTKRDHLGEEEANEEEDGQSRKRRSSISSASSTSTELCDDEIHRLSDFDSEEASSDVPAHYPLLVSNEISDSVKHVSIPTENQRSEKERHEEVRKCAVELIHYIERELQKSDRLQHLKTPPTNNNNTIRTENYKDLLSTSNHDNTIGKSPVCGGVEKEFLKTEPEVPIAGNVIDNAENKIFDRSKEEMVESQPKITSAECSINTRDRRKSDLALSVIKENLEMLNKFSQKTSVKEDKENVGKVIYPEETENLEMLTKFSHKRSLKEEKVIENVGKISHTENEKKQEREEVKPKEVQREEGVTNEKTDLFGDHFRKGEVEIDKTTERIFSESENIVCKVNKEVNTDITIATDVGTSPVMPFEMTHKTEPTKVDDFLINLMSSRPIHKSPERFKPDKIDYRGNKEGECAWRFTREDLAEKWQKESEKIESKIELSKSDWDLKMKKIAELENTTREKLNEMKSKSIVHRHRSLDRFEGRDREKRKSPIPRIQVPEDEAEDLERRKKKISALSFDEITSRTEKLLGTNLTLDLNYKKWRKSFDEDTSTCKSFEFYSSPTSPEYRQRKYTEYSSPKRYESKWKHSQTGEEDWLTITEENGRPKTIDLVSPGRKTEKDGSPHVRSPVGFNPFPTRTLSKPKELAVKLGMYPSSPEGAHSSKKS